MLKTMLLGLYLLILGLGFWLKYLNLSHLKKHGGTVPREFEGSIDPDLLAKITAYTVENNRVSLVESVISSALFLAFIFGGLLGVYDRWITSLSSNFIISGLFFALFLHVFNTIIDIPFSLYHNFKIENRYGFNTMTYRLWIMDLVKSLALSLVIGGLVSAAMLAIVAASPAWWWLWVWLFLLVFGVFMMYVSPYIIEPLFYKFEPVRNEGLEEKIRDMMNRVGVKVSRVFQVDASRRSRHSNAYFTGIGRVKRIVLFDTLIAQMSQQEILSVLAHEIGHWKKKHVLKRIVLTQISAFAGLFLAYHLIGWKGLPGIIGLEQASFFARFVIVMFLASLATFPFTPLFSFFSRKHEYESDKFAADLTGDPDSMASALVKLSRENLSNLHPHPLYAKFYYSHPPVVERIRQVRKSGRSER